MSFRGSTTERSFPPVTSTVRVQGVDVEHFDMKGAGLPSLVT